MKRFEEFINEGIMGFLKPKSKEDVLKYLKSMDTIEKLKIKNTRTQNLPYDINFNDIYPSDDELLQYFKTIDALEVMHTISYMKWAHLPYDNYEKFYPPKEKLKKSLDKLDTFDKLDRIYQYKLSDYYYPTSKEINDTFEQFGDNFKIEYVIKYNLNFDTLPRDEGICIYDGSLTINNFGLKKLPEKFTVYGNLNCAANNLTELPKDLTVEGHLDCYDNNLTKLPENLYVKGNVTCYNNDKKLGWNDSPNISIKGSLFN